LYQVIVFRNAGHAAARPDPKMAAARPPAVLRQKRA